MEASVNAVVSTIKKHGDEAILRRLMNYMRHRPGCVMVGSFTCSCGLLAVMQRARQLDAKLHERP